MSDSPKASVLRSWDEVWEVGKKLEATHYNYCRGRKRFRGIFDDPEEIGTAAQIGPADTVRIRFYQETEQDYIELSEEDVYLRLPNDYLLELPQDFGEMDASQKTQVVLAQMHKISALRWQRQADAAEKVLWQYIDYLNKTIEKKEALIAALQKRNEELLASRGINNIYDFLVHPNAEKAIGSISAAIGEQNISESRIAKTLEKLLPAVLKQAEESNKKKG